MSKTNLLNNTPANAAVVTIEESLSKPLTATQRKFNASIKKIEKQKALLQAWQAASDQCQQDAVAKFEPLKKDLAEQQVRLVDVLETIYHTQKLTKPQQEKTAHFICRLCVELIQEAGRDEFKAVYNRYQPDDEADYEEKKEMESAMLRAALEAEFGVQIDDDFDINDPEAIAQKLFEKQESEREQAEQQAQQNREQRRKSAKQLAKEAKEQEEQTNISKSIQAVYRQLVAALHPDREPDSEARERKTIMMQQVTVAYDKKDLLKLLELQLSVEQIDQNSIYNIAEDRLKHYIKVLDTQYKELKDEVEEIELRYMAMLGLPYYERLTPKRVLLLLKDDIRSLGYQIKQMQDDIHLFARDTSYFKLWLRDYRI